jgi:rod shape-determining protein MreB and related proteins
MALSLVPRLGLDLGTSKTVLISGGRIVYDEPTALVSEMRSNRVLYSGKAAAERAGKLGPGSEVIRPVARGSIADYAATCFLLGSVFSLAMRPPRILRPMVVASVPIRLNSVEERALCDAAREAGAGQIYLIPCNLASYVAVSNNLNDPRGSLVVDIGAGVTDISVMASNEIIVGRTLQHGGEDLTAIVQRVVEMTFGVTVGREEALRAKIETGLVPRGEETVLIRRADTSDATGFRQASIPQGSLADFLRQGLKPLIEGVLETLEETPAELYEDIFYRGIFLTGGGSRLKGLAPFLEERLELKVHQSADPELTAIRGIGKIISEFSQFRKFFRHHVAF